MLKANKKHRVLTFPNNIQLCGLPRNGIKEMQLYSLYQGVIEVCNEI